MINFRYHIVSLMAVFIALAVGIAVGVSLSPAVGEGIITQADQDRKQVTELRAELSRRDALDAYRDTWAQQVGVAFLGDELRGTRVALVTMPSAPGAVTDAISTAVQGAGGLVVADVKVNDEVFDPARAGELNDTFDQIRASTGIVDSMSTPTKFGRALARAVASPTPGPRDPAAKRVGAVLASSGLANVREDVVPNAQLVIVVTAPSATPPLAADVLGAHVETELALKQQDPEVGVVLAGPDSKGVENTDVLTARITAQADTSLSTVDVADLPSGVSTVVLAGKEQLLGRQGHYGALTRADAALPKLPVVR